MDFGSNNSNGNGADVLGTIAWDLASDFIGALDASRCILHVNPAWANAIQPCDPLEQLVNIVHPNDVDFFSAELVRGRGQTSPSEFSCRVRGVGGDYRTVAWRVLVSDNVTYLSGRDVSGALAFEDELTEAQQSLADAYQKLTFYMMNSPLAFVEWDRSLRVVYWSPEAERAFGWSTDIVLDRRIDEWSFVAEEDQAEFQGTLIDLVYDTAATHASLCRHYRPDGSVVVCEWFHSTLRDENGEVQTIFSLALDVTERKRTESDLLKIRKAFESASDAICIADGDGHVIHVNNAFKEVFGWTLADLSNFRIDGLLTDLSIRDEASRFLAGGHSWRGEAEVRNQSGDVIPIQMRIDAIREESGATIGQIAVCTDLRERKQAERELIHQALHDTLTGLPNRAFFTERLDRAFSRSADTGGQVACIFVDVDNFKVINDSLGHAAGDELLIIVAQRLRASVRPEDMVARLGGDEFVIVIEGISKIEQATQVASRVMESLQSVISLNGREVIITASVGIASASAADGTPSNLLRDADVAMYQAKTGGKASYVLFDAKMNEEAMERLELEIDLRRAIDRNELEVYYQPIVQLASGQITEVEALIRWRHPQRGFIGPGKFIPIAEQTGLIDRIGEWILEEACTRCESWRARPDIGQPITVSVNLSTRQLLQDDLVERVQAVLERTGLPSSLLKLEITESVMMMDSAAAIAKLHELKALGIRLAIDDFGTGYSSMAYLSSLPVETLKIDRAFVSRIGQADDDAIVGAILHMAKTLGLKVTAEGIESSDQLRELENLGCDRGQGYLFAKPLPLADFEQALLRNRQKAADDTKMAA